MGCCTSSANEKGEVDNTRGTQNDSDTNKLLFLGPGGCGKSTLFKQLRKIFGTTFGDEERTLFGEHIHTYVIETVLHVLTQMEDPSKMSKEAQQAEAFMQSLVNKTVVGEAIAANIKILWNEPIFKEVFQEEAKVKLFHSCTHFLDDIDRIGTSTYVPTDLDIILQRRPTTGLVQQKLCINETWFQIFDVGGQKNERRKWFHQFENVSAVIFVASLSSFDEQMFDDETVNSLQDSIDLFEEICKSPYFVHQHMILILNKRDLLEEKLKSGKKLKDYPATSDYSGKDDDAEASVKSIEEKFQLAFLRSVAQLRKSTLHETQTAAETRLLFVRYTCAFQTESVQTVFRDVQGILTGKITTNEQLSPL